MAYKIETEQTNSSFVIPELVLPDAPHGVILKVLRYPAPSPHPDFEVPKALHDAGYTSIPRVISATTVDIPGQGATDIAILSEFIPNTIDGFTLACEYAKRGESFAIQAENLGKTIGQLHRAFQIAFPSTIKLNPKQFIKSLQQRAKIAISTVPELAVYQEFIFVVYDELEQHLAQAEIQRIHGDLHLGQLLYRDSATDAQNDGSWYIIDFEGEPLRPAAERSAPDLVERDVAGMIRSFYYAVAVANVDEIWAIEAAEAFLQGYRRHRRIDQALLNALVLDKALYEAVYEKRHRPDWLPIPMAAITHIIHDYQVKSDELRKPE